MVTSFRHFPIKTLKENSMLSELRDPLYLKMKQRLPDGEGGWKEKEAGVIMAWGRIRPLSSAKAPATKPLEAVSRTSFPAGERVEITIRARSDLLEIAEVIWDKRTLIPLSQPFSDEKHPGFLSFQALLIPLKEEGAS